jgi:hypothetical protein
MKILFALLVLASLGGWLNDVFQDRRAEPKPDTDGPDQLDTADPLAPPFKAYQESVTEILERNPQRRDDLRRELNAATEIWEEAEFNAVVKPLKRDRDFRRSIKAAKRAADDTQT